MKFLEFAPITEDDSYAVMLADCPLWNEETYEQESWVVEHGEGIIRINPFTRNLKEAIAYATACARRTYPDKAAAA